MSSGVKESPVQQQIQQVKITRISNDQGTATRVRLSSNVRPTPTPCDVGIARAVVSGDGQQLEQFANVVQTAIQQRLVKLGERVETERKIQDPDVMRRLLKRCIEMNRERQQKQTDGHKGLREDWNTRLLRAVVVIYGLKESVLQSNQAAKLLMREVESVKEALHQIQDQIGNDQTDSQLFPLLSNLYELLRQLNSVVRAPVDLTLQLGPTPSIVDKLSLDSTSEMTMRSPSPSEADMFGVVELQDWLLNVEKDMWMTERGLQKLSKMAVARYLPDLPEFEAQLRDMVARIHEQRKRLKHMEHRSENYPYNRETKWRLIRDIERLDTELQGLRRQTLDETTDCEMNGSPQGPVYLANQQNLK